MDMLAQMLEVIETLGAWPKMVAKGFISLIPKGEGVEALNTRLVKIIDGAGLIEKKLFQVDRVGVFPGNREDTMLVPIDVQDLLLRLAMAVAAHALLVKARKMWHL